MDPHTIYYDYAPSLVQTLDTTTTNNNNNNNNKNDMEFVSQISRIHSFKGAYLAARLNTLHHISSLRTRMDQLDAYWRKEHLEKWSVLKRRAGSEVGRVLEWIRRHVDTDDVDDTDDVEMKGYFCGSKGEEMVMMNETIRELDERMEAIRREIHQLKHQQLTRLHYDFETDLPEDFTQLFSDDDDDDNDGGGDSSGESVRTRLDVILNLSKTPVVGLAPPLDLIKLTTHVQTTVRSQLQRISQFQTQVSHLSHVTLRSLDSRIIALCQYSTDMDRVRQWSRVPVAHVTSVFERVRRNEWERGVGEVVSGFREWVRREWGRECVRRKTFERELGEYVPNSREWIGVMPSFNSGGGDDDVNSVGGKSELKWHVVWNRVVTWVKEYVQLYPDCSIGQQLDELIHDRLLPQLNQQKQSLITTTATTRNSSNSRNSSRNSRSSGRLMDELEKERCVRQQVEMELYRLRNRIARVESENEVLLDQIVTLNNSNNKRRRSEVERSVGVQTDYYSGSLDVMTPSRKAASVISLPETTTTTTTTTAAIMPSSGGAGGGGSAGSENEMKVVRQLKQLLIK